MYPSRDSLAGILFIVGLVSAAHWYAGHFDVPGGASLHAAAEPQSRPVRIAVRAIDWSADGRTLLAHSRDWNGNQKVLLRSLPPTAGAVPIEVTREPIGAVALAPDGRHILLGTTDGTLLWIDVPSLETIALVEATPQTFFSAATVAADGQLVAAATGVGRIFVCDTQQGTVVEYETGYERAPLPRIDELRFSDDGLSLLSCHADGSIVVWDVPTCRRRQDLPGHHGTATGAAFLPDGRQIISVGHDDRVRIWDIASGREEWQAQCGLAGVNALAVSPDGKSAACGGRNGRIVVWDLVQRLPKLEFTAAAVVVKDLQFSFDGGVLAAAGLERVIRIYDMQSGVEHTMLTFTPATSPETALAGQ